MFVQFVMSTLIRVCFEMRFYYIKLGKVFFFFFADIELCRHFSSGYELWFNYYHY